MRRARALALLLATLLSSVAQAQSLTSEFLLGRAPLAAPVATSEFTVPRDARPPSTRIEGRLRLSGVSVHGEIRVLKDDYGYATSPALQVGHLPAFDFEFVQDGSALIPTRRGPQRGAHPHWEWIVEPGVLWKDARDGGADRAVIPFSLQERNANCMHNGLLAFLIAQDGRISRVAYQIGSETCRYFKANLWGAVPARYLPAPIAGSDSVRQAYRREIAARLPTKPIEALGKDHGGVNSTLFGSAEEIPPDEMTAFGFVVDGTHYTGGCNTRFGPHPLCAAIDLPSYSLAKTLFAGFALMRLEKLFPGVSRERIADHLPECARNTAWKDVTFGNALDMATGNYSDATYDVDEVGLGDSEFFTSEDHVTKITLACGRFPHRAKPGTQWVYHTSDTYLLGTALQSFFRKRLGADRDVYRDVLVAPLWQALGLSPLLDTTRRTRDQHAQPFAGWGLTLLPDDIARIGQFLTRDRARLGNDGFFDPASFESSLQRDPQDRGLVSLDASFRYNNGFWAHDIGAYIGCSAPVWVPYLVGFGGIIVLLLPNDTVYYYFSDGGTFRWARAAAEANRIRPMCPGPP